VTGFVVDGPEQAVEAVGRVSTLCRRRCRLAFERRFTVSRMAEAYLGLYQRVVELAAEAEPPPPQRVA
jgi:hypothetical protein